MSDCFGKTKNGIGSYELTNGDKRYRVVYRVRGKVRSKAGFKTKGAAKQWQADNTSAVNHGGWIDPVRGRKTFGTYAMAWIETRKLRANTVALYSGLLRSYIYPTFENLALNAIGTEDVRYWLASLRKMKVRTKSGVLSDSTVLKAHTLMKAILSTAVDDGYIVANPCRRQRAEDVDPQNCPTVEQVLALATAVPLKYKAMVLLAGFGGLRWGEVIAVRRDVVDLERGCVLVREQVNEINNTTIVVSPMLKTAAGRRTVYLPDVVIEALRQHIERYMGDDDDALLFTSTHRGGQG